MLQPFRGKNLIRHCKIRIPPDAPEGQMMLTVCDYPTDCQMESQEMPQRSRPETLTELIDYFRQPHRTSDIALRLTGGQRQGLAIRGKELPELPDSVVSVLGKQSPPDVTPFTTATVRYEPTEYVIVGAERVQISVVKPEPRIGENR